MILHHFVPSWHEIESRIADRLGYQGSAHLQTSDIDAAPSLALTLRRVWAVQSTFNQAEWQAARLLSKRFADLQIHSVLDEFWPALHNADLIAGGKNAIADFGDHKVNSTDGPQWKSKVQNLKKLPKLYHWKAEAKLE